MVDTGPVNAFTVFCDVVEDEFIRVEASDGQIYIKAKGDKSDMLDVELWA